MTRGLVRRAASGDRRSATHRTTVSMVVGAAVQALAAGGPTYALCCRLVAMAAGFACFGLFCFAWAKNAKH